MAGTVLYRKWRPHRFADIVGQDPIVRTLKNAVAQDKVSHAYLFCGPRGTGKTTTGRILAKTINCEHDSDGEPILDSDKARAFDEGRALDLVEIDAASNRGIDNIRDLRDRANYVPTSSRFKVYLIDEVHQLTDAAADALLKTLEEPPPHVVFILATSDPDALKPTVLSRCQRFDFRRVSLPDIAGRLRQIAHAEGITIPDEALNLLAREATGSLRDAVNLLDQVWAAYGDEVSLDDAVAALGLTADKRALELARAALTKELQRGLQLIIGVQEDAVDLARFNRQVVQHLRHALLLQTGAADGLALSDVEQEALRTLVEGVDSATTVAALKAFAAADMRGDPYASLPLELALAQLVYEPEAPSTVPAGAPAPAARDAAAAEGRRAPPRRRRARPPAPGPQPAPAEARARSQEGPPAVAPPPPRARPEPTPDEQRLLDIRAALRRRRELKLDAALNRSCKILRVEDDVVTLGFFPFAVDFHKGKVEEKIAVVAEAASEVFGRPVTVRCEAAEDEPKRESALVEAAVKQGARVVDRRDG